MSDLDKAKAGVRIAIEAVDLLEAAIRAATTAIGSARADLKKAEAELAEFEDRLQLQRNAADDKLDKKFDRES